MSWVVGVEGLCGAFPDGCAVTLGVFDGVHRGHAALVEATVRWARAQGVPRRRADLRAAPRRRTRA
jgi:FAD synthase